MSIYTYYLFLDYFPTNSRIIFKESWLKMPALYWWESSNVQLRHSLEEESRHQACDKDPKSLRNIGAQTPFGSIRLHLEEYLIRGEEEEAFNIILFRNYITTVDAESFRPGH
ncbi:hypothetical protein AVEN_263129-1 [Araneus ventricosus]|uniref:Uncharacterized protein n=1 Tax=Araneus ventricosus TaxID=182803 RepID=A0A4Y2F893_ARAVE|nr:hypothetical protein AVEN_263129-1 [Araneus ventricosus]